MLASQFLSVFALVHYGIVAYFLSVEHVRLKLLDGFKKSKISLMLRKGYVKPSTIFQQAELKYQDFLQSAKFASSSSSTQQQQARAAMKKTTDSSSTATSSSGSSSFFFPLRLRGGGRHHHGKHNKIGAADEVKRNMLLEMIKIDEVEEEDAEEEQGNIQISSNNVNHHQQPTTTKTAAAVSNTSSTLPPSMNFDFVLSDVERGGSFNDSEYNGSAPPSSRFHGDDSTPPPLPESLTAIAGVNHPPPHRILHHLNSFDLHQFTLSNNTANVAPFSNNETLHNHHTINHPSYHGKANTTTTTTTTTAGTAGKSFDSQSGLARRRGSAAESVASSRCSSSKDSVGRALVVLTTFEVLTIAYVKEAFEEFDYDHTGVLNIMKLKMVSRSICISHNLYMSLC
jgi:hypothetical protein